MRNIVIGIGVLICGVIVSVIAPPLHVPSNSEIVIAEGDGIATIALQLDAAGVVYSKTLAQTIIILRGGERRVQAGTYLFDERLNVWDVTTRLLDGDLGVAPLSVRIPEGSTREQMGQILSDALTDFDAEEFMIASNGLEGYLFPDTYLFRATDSPERVVDILNTTFEEKTADLKRRVEAAGKSFDEIVIIGSLIEGEVADVTDRRLVSGVIQNRLAIDMALQLDASFVFLLGKGSAELTLEDLEYDSPYNTYLYPGLPPGPIGAPSLDSMEAAFDPTPSDYLFYLSDADGVTHFAEDFDEHRVNKAKYLR